MGQSTVSCQSKSQENYAIFQHLPFWQVPWGLLSAMFLAGFHCWHMWQHVFLSPDTRALLATLLCWQGSLSMIKSSCPCHFGPDRAKAILKCVRINCVKNCPSIFSYTSSRTTPFPLVIATNKCNWGPPAKSLLPFAANCRPSFFFLHIRLFVPATACRGLRLWTKGTPLK